MPTYFVLVACRDLKNDDGSSAEISVIRATGEEDEIGKTAELMGDDPVFKKVFEVDSDNPDDMLKVTILDDNDQTRGVTTFTIGKVLEHEKKLGFMEMSADRGAVVVHIVEKVEEGSLKLKLRAKDVKNVEGITGLRKPDPFYIISKLMGRSGGEDEWAKVFTSPVVKNELSPEWDEVEIEVKELCDSDFDLTLRLQVYDEESFGRDPVIIGSLETTLAMLLSSSGSDECVILEEASEQTGQVFVDNAELDGCVNSKKDAKELMKLVAKALKNRSDANEKAESIEKIKEEAATAKEAAEAAQLLADQKAEAVTTAEEELANAIAAADAAEAELGGLGA